MTLVPEKLKTEIEKGVALIMSNVVSLTIATPEHLLNAAALTREIKTTAKLVTDERKKIVNPLNAQVDEVNAFFGQFVGTDKKPGMLDTAESTLKGAMRSYEVEQKRIADEAQAKIDAEAKAQRDKEDAALRKEEAARLAQIEAERKASEEQDTTKKAALEAEAAAKRKEADKAAQVATAAAEKAATKENTIVKSAYVAPSGTYNVTTYTGEEEDKAAFVKHCLDTNQLFYLSIEMGKVNKTLQNSEGTMRFPGIRTVSAISTRMRSR